MPEAEIHPDAKASKCRAMSPSSWTAMDVGRRRAGCRASKGTGAGWRRCAAPIRAAGEIGIKVITIYSFSAENWSRPATEIGELMGLLRRFVRNDLAELHQQQRARAHHRRP